MAFKFYDTITIFFLLSTDVLLSSAATNPQYSLCSTSLFSCGKIQNVSYPFWGESRPQFCGRQNFQLDCPDLSVYPFIFGLGTGSDSLSGKVININTSSQTMSVVEKPFLNSSNVSCQKLIRNVTDISLSKPFKLSPRVTNITLFFDCVNHSIKKYQPYYQSFLCSDDVSADETAYYVYKQADDVSKVISESCNMSRVFPVMKSALDDMSKVNGTILEVLAKGFEVEYMVDIDECQRCKKSGGLCGSSESLTSTFRCYCPNGGHPQICPKSEKKPGIYIAIGIGGGVVVFVVLLAVWYRKHLNFRKPQLNSLEDRSASELGRESRYLGVPLFSYKELEEATNNFDQKRELGGGGYGTVYYGKLKDGREVAVKHLYEKSFKRVEQFMNEVQLLTCVRHRNLVSLYGCTSCHSRELLLVYEYVSNGTVADHLHGHKASSGSLSWTTRLKIAIETATALSYLHASDIIHRDVKTYNILLDENFNVKVADFGLSRLFPNDVTHVSTAPQGTPGYVDPEYHQCYQLTDKSDVYSFGVVLIELISSLRAVDMNRHSYEINLSNYAMNRIKRCAFSDLVDPQLGFESDFKVRRMTTAVSELAFRCLQHYRDFRPSMDEVLEVLKRIQSVDYEALQIEESGKNGAVQITNLSASPTNNDGVKLLRDHLLWRSPTSVMEIVSSSTTSNSKSS